MKVYLSLLFLLLLLYHNTLCSNEFRIDCYNDNGVTKKLCEARDCIWSPALRTDPEDTPSCFMKADKIGYRVKLSGINEWILVKNEGPKNPFGKDFSFVKFSYKNIGKSVINIRIEDPKNKRYEAGDILNLPRNTVETREELRVSVNQNSDPFSFSVQRRNGATIFNNSIGGLIFSDQFIQIATTLPSNNMYGWGEHVHPNLKHDFTRYTKWGMFSRDEWPDSRGLSTKNLYGVHPFYILVESNGEAHGVLFLNSNAQDVITTPGPGYIYRTIGGIIDIYFFPGPSPADVVRQYTAFIGRPMLPPYWSLGYQLCRYGYKSLQDLKDRIESVRSYSIPIEVAYADIDYMDRYRDFTIGEKWIGFGDYVRELHQLGMKAIVNVNPAIEVDYDPFRRAMETNAQFIEWERPDEVMRSIQDRYPLAKNTKIILSIVWPDKHVSFPDFLDPLNKTNEWWTNEFKLFHNQIPIDGVWIDMNEPSAFSTNDKTAKIPPLQCPTTGPDSFYDMPPYKTQAVYLYGKNAYLASKTVCMRGVQMRGKSRLYDTHSLYGWSESKATIDAIQKSTNHRGFVVSRSTFPSSGRYAGHWLGDNYATWQDLRSAVIGVMDFNMFGIPYVGSDVCGFMGKTTEELCLRWQQLGSFHSFFRNHNADDQPYQDPAVWPTVAAASKKSNEFRYSFLNYLYSLHYRSALYGDTVIHPLFFDFPNDSITYNISEEFMWGPSVLVIPVLKQGHIIIKGYIPNDDFYSIYEYNYGQKVPIGWSDFPAPYTYNTPTFLRGGSIIPRQPPSMTTRDVRMGAFNLLIISSIKGATGYLYWDDVKMIVEDINTHPHTFIQFYHSIRENQSFVDILVGHTGGPSIPKLEYLEIFNFPSRPLKSSFTLNKKPIQVKMNYKKNKKILKVYFKELIDFSYKDRQIISWNHKSIIH